MGAFFLLFNKTKMILIQIFRRNCVAASGGVAAAPGDGVPSSAKGRSPGHVPSPLWAGSRSWAESQEIRGNLPHGNWGCGTRRGFLSRGIPILGPEEEEARGMMQGGVSPA